MAKKGLGRSLGKGLDALIPSLPQIKQEEDDQKEEVSEITLEQIDPNPEQPRKNFEPEALAELASSIQEHGLIQPLVVRSVGKGRYQLIVGERRWRACKSIGLNKVPVIIKNWDDQKVAEIALIENIQRKNLTPVEEAEAFRSLLEDFSLTQEELAKRVGKSRTYITNSLRLLQLNEKVQSMINMGQITTGHAKAIMALSDGQDQELMAQTVLEEGWSVRKTEDQIREKLGREKKVKEPLDENNRGYGEVTVNPKDKDIPDKGRAEKRTYKDPEIIALEERMRTWLKTQVKIKHYGEKGTIEISYYSLEDLQRVFDCFFDEQEK
ncbi:ParB/RepB/Spo0J family partition protein [Heliorestis convoluta]|uniref:ParB/RepB/Spo0J family partition protein n=1 Tax=Heliorestis convoluta TaxID=356322 RepID=A0A5Q2MX19_9FIRM|nr:ParB/RepB/Spo0J family partition protein [Heliorestis convoluta]QGG46997.1 ParB/RepB/Spo0J family partition protein [Heliorestis convoluta]